MNNRERFQAIMHYQARDRTLISDFSFWDETLVVWQEQGLPKFVDRVTADPFFGMDIGLDNIRHPDVCMDLSPAFEYKVLEDQGDHHIVQQEDGVRVRARKFMSSIPQPVAHLLQDRESWERHYKPRLDPTHPSRYPADWQAHVQEWTDEDRDYLLILPGGSLYGKLRNWMGVENLSLVLYDDPTFFEEMVNTVADCILATLTRILETGGKFDACGMWEDMCYNRGPLISPAHFKRYLLPHYRRIADLLHKHGVDVIWLDCDGNIEKLLPLWLDAGINCMFPIEIGTWGADPIAYRRQFGKDLLIMGGFDKHILADSKEAIEAEIWRLQPLIEEGGYIGFCDHRVPPDVPLENYIFYLKKVREIWCQDIDLPPMPALALLNHL